MTEIIGQIAPPRLFKYVEPKRVDILRDRRIRFTQQSSLNDVFEMQPVFTRIASEEDISAVIAKMPREKMDAHSKRMMRQRRRLGESVSLRDVRREFHANRPAVIRHVDATLQGQLPELREKFITQLHAIAGVLCLTEDPCNILMWAHYASRHEGFLIEFETNHTWFALGREPGKIWGYLGAVRYADQRVLTPIS